VPKASIVAVFQGGQVAIRPLRPEPRATGEHDVRLEPAQTLVVPTLLVQNCQGQVRQEYVRHGDQLFQDLTAVRFGEIHGETLFVAMSQLVE